MPKSKITIARLAAAAGVGVETVRYYERRGLMARPARNGGAFREYTPAHIARIQFIRRAQELGFSLDEIGSLLSLEDGTDRKAIRQIASARLDQIRGRIATLRRMEHALSQLLRDCEVNGRAARCPIIAAIETEPVAQGKDQPRRDVPARHAKSGAFP